MLPITDGKGSSEYLAARRASTIGEIALGLGAAVALLGGGLERWVLTGSGLGLAAIGAGLVAAALHAYAHARARVKAAASSPASRIVGKGL